MNQSAELAQGSLLSLLNERTNVTRKNWFNCWTRKRVYILASWQYRSSESVGADRIASAEKKRNIAIGRRNRCVASEVADCESLTFPFCFPLDAGRRKSRGTIRTGSAVRRLRFNGSLRAKRGATSRVSKNLSKDIRLREVVSRVRCEIFDSGAWRQARNGDRNRL